MSGAEEVHDELVERIALAEGLRTEMVTPLVAMRTGASVGDLATLTGVNVDKAVGVDMTFDVGEALAWARTFHVFARNTSLVPHLAMEWFGSGDGASVRVLIDLFPRIDLAVNLDYVDEVYGPLTGVHRDLIEIPGVSVERIPPRRATGMSPWRLSVSVPADRVEALVPAIEKYVEHWLALNIGGVDATIDPLSSDQARLIQHDRFHRTTLFDAGSDPHWERVDRLLGPDRAAELRFTLRSQYER